METQMEQKVTKDMTIGEVVRKYPAAAEIMLSYGLHCVGCHVNPFETIFNFATINTLHKTVIQEPVHVHEDWAIASGIYYSRKGK